MNSRQAKLLLKMLDEKEIKIADWIEENKISERTLRNDILLLERVMGGTGHVLLKGGRVKACIQSDCRQEIEKMIADSDFYWYKLSRNERVLIACLMLMIQEGYVTSDKIAQTLCVSRNTIVSEMGENRKWLARHGLKLETKNRYGFCVKGSEVALRRAIADIALEGVERNSIVSLMLRRMLYHREDYGIVEKAVMTCEKAYGLNLSDTVFQKMVLDILIILNRVNSGHFVKGSNSSADSRLQKIAAGILATLDDRLQLGLHARGETEFLAQQLKNRIPLQNVKDQGLSSPTEMLAFSFASGICIDCNVEDQISQETMLYLVANIAGMLERSKHGETIAEGLYKKGIEDSYPAVCNAVNTRLTVLKKFMERDVNQDEFAYLVLCFVSAIEELTMMPVKTLLVCSSGKDTAFILKTKLERHFKINVLNTLSMHSVNESSMHQTELIISTGAIQSMDKPVVQLDNYLLEKQDILKIHEQIENVYKKRFRDCVQERFDGKASLELSLSSLLQVDMIQLDVRVADWKEAIRVAGALLVEKDKADHCYIDKIIENVMKFGPYIAFLPGVVIAHAGYEDGGKALAFSAVRLREPIRFGHETNDPVKWVFCVSTTKHERHQGPMFQLMRILTNQTTRKEMDKVKSPEEIMKLLY